MGRGAWLTAGSCGSRGRQALAPGGRKAPGAFHGRLRSAASTLRFGLPATSSPPRSPRKRGRQGRVLCGGQPPDPSATHQVQRKQTGGTPPGATPHTLATAGPESAAPDREPGRNGPTRCRGPRGSLPRRPERTGSPEQTRGRSWRPWRSHRSTAGRRRSPSDWPAGKSPRSGKHGPTAGVQRGPAPSPAAAEDRTLRRAGRCSPWPPAPARPPVGDARTQGRMVWGKGDAPGLPGTECHGNCFPRQPREAALPSAPREARQSGTHGAAGGARGPAPA